MSSKQNSGDPYSRPQSDAEKADKLDRHLGAQRCEALLPLSLAMEANAVAHRATIAETVRKWKGNYKWEIVTGLGIAQPQQLVQMLLETIDLLAEKINAWLADDSIACIVLSSSSERAFCAGADITVLYQSILKARGGDNPYAQSFFLNEYTLNYTLHTASKPIVVWGNGIVMGGGFGLLGGCSHRIGTPTTRIAMPEITIGLFPDAGGTKFLSASQDVSERASRYVSELASQHIFERVSISELASQCIFVVFLSLASQHISPLNIFQSSPFNTFQSSPLNIFLIAMYGASN